MSKRISFAKIITTVDTHVKHHGVAVDIAQTHTLFENKLCEADLNIAWCRMLGHRQIARAIARMKQQRTLQ